MINTIYCFQNIKLHALPKNDKYLQDLGMFKFWFYHLKSSIIKVPNIK